MIILFYSFTFVLQAVKILLQICLPMSGLLHTMLLLGWPAYAAQQASELKKAPPGLPIVTTTGSLHVVAREGSSALIACNVTGEHDDVQWFNSRGALAGEGGALLLGIVGKTLLAVLPFFLLSLFFSFQSFSQIEFSELLTNLRNSFG